MAALQNPYALADCDNKWVKIFTVERGEHSDVNHQQNNLNTAISEAASTVLCNTKRNYQDPFDENNVPDELKDIEAKAKEILEAEKQEAEEEKAGQEAGF